MTRSLWQRLFWLALMVAAFNYLFFTLAPPPQERILPVSYSRFKAELKQDAVAEVTFQGDRLFGRFHTPVDATATGNRPPQASVSQFQTRLPPIPDPDLWRDLEEHQVEIRVLPEEEPSPWASALIYLLPWVLIIGIWYLIIRGMRSKGGAGGGFMGGFSKSGAKVFSRESSSVTFDDVAGLDEAKQELLEVVEFLRHPRKFTRLGGKVPRGVLLVGPPGTGKTLMARAVAGEAGVPFFSIAASQFIEMFVGVGAGRVRDLFESAKKAAPSIVFIDELDAVGRARGTGLGGGNDEREQTLNQLLSEMDGFDPHAEVIVMSATNRPDVLDTALLRPGRFDRQVMLDRPDWRAREAILKVHTRKTPLAADVDLLTLAKGTPGLCGADLENLVNEAALLAAREDREVVDAGHLERAKDRLLMGAERKLLLSEEEKRLTAYHEAGHTLVAVNVPGADPIHKVSIIPRGQALGVTQQLPVDDRYHYGRSYLLSRIAVSLGGRAAEKAVFHEVSTGAQNDLKQATDLAEKMVCQWGMSDKLGPVTFSRGEEHPFLGRKLAVDKTFSEQMAWIIDQEIEKIVKQGEQVAEGIVAAQRPALERLVTALLEEEVLEKSRVDEILQIGENPLETIEGDSGSDDTGKAGEGD